MVIILNKSGIKSVEYMLELVKQGKLVITDEAKFIEENGMDDIDYNDFKLVY